MSDARTDAEREADLLDDAELGEMLEEAGAILSEPPRKHEYRDPDYKGGPRNKDEHEMLDAGIRLNAARIVVEETADVAMQANLQLYELMEGLMNDGIPVDFIAEHSGFRHRSSVYRIVRQQLPRLREMRSKIASARAALAQEGGDIHT